MDIKFTLRDIFAYFLVGFYVFLCLLFFTYKELLNISKETYTIIKDFMGFGLFLILILYLLGVFVQGIDNIIYLMMMPLYNILKRGRKYLLCKWISKFFFGMRMQYSIDYPYKMNSVDRIWAINEKEEIAYWKVAQQSNEGFFRASCISLIVGLIILDKVAVICFLLLSVLFWVRARRIIADNLIGFISNT